MRNRNNGADADQPAERRLEALAVDGVVTRSAALASGLSRHVIDHRIEIGFLCAEGRGVYRLCGAALEGRTAERAALDVSSGRALGLWSANVAHGVNRGLIPPKPHVIVKHPGGVKKPKFFFQYPTRRIDDHEVVIANARPVTTMPRTIRDFAAFLPQGASGDGRIRRYVEEAIILKKLTLSQLETAAKEESSTKIRARLLSALDYQLGSDPDHFRSVGEAWLKDLVVRRALPMPLFNVRALGGDLAEADAWFPDVPLIIEFDGFTFHHTRTKHDRDRARDRRAWSLARIHTMRITKTDFEDDLPQLEADIESAVLFPDAPLAGRR